MCPVINNKYHCQFTLYFILHSAFSYKLSVFKLAAEYRNICPQLVAKYLHICLQHWPNISILPCLTGCDNNYTPGSSRQIIVITTRFGAGNNYMPCSDLDLAIWIIVNHYRAYICYQPSIFGEVINICPVVINNKPYIAMSTWL